MIPSNVYTFLQDSVYYKQIRDISITSNYCKFGGRSLYEDEHQLFIILMANCLCIYYLNKLLE